MLRLYICLFISLCAYSNYAWQGMPTPKLHIDVRYLKNPHGNIVTLHGFAQTYRPWFNKRGKFWTNYNINDCFEYNNGVTDDIIDVGSKINFLQLHMDPYWGNTPECTSDGHELPNCFDKRRFKKYL